MKKYSSIVFAAFFVLTTACASTPTKDIKITAEVDPKANFSGYKSYAWLGSARIIQDEDGVWEPPKFDADAELKFLINDEMRNRGIEEVVTRPDMLVAFALGVDMDTLKLKKNPETKIKTLENVPQGALVVILVDTDTGYVIWAGEAEAEVQKDATEEVVKARLKYVVKEMFKLIPKD